MNIIGENIKRIRIKKGISKEELARRAGYKSASMITSIEEGSREPSFSKNLNIAKALGVSVNDLLGKKSDGLTEKERILLGGVGEYLEELPESEIKMGVHLFKLVYVSYLDKAGRIELDKIVDKNSLEYHKKKYEKITDINESFGDDDRRIFPDRQEKMFQETVNNIKKGKDPRALNTIEVLKNGKRESKDTPKDIDVEIVIYTQKTDEGYEYEITVTKGGKEISRGSGLSESDSAAGAIIESLQETLTGISHIKANSITIYTESEYIRKGINEWVDTWSQNGWKKSDGEEIKYQDFWKLIGTIKKEIKLRAEETWKK